MRDTSSVRSELSNQPSGASSLSDTPNQTFKITVPITTCYLCTTADGVEKYVIEGRASNTDLDRTGERMADTAIKSMASSLATHPVVFKNERTWR